MPEGATPDGDANPQAEFTKNQNNIRRFRQKNAPLSNRTAARARPQSRTSRAAEG
jgi:hypothetical protein